MLSFVRHCRKKGISFLFLVCSLRRYCIMPSFCNAHAAPGPGVCSVWIPQYQAAGVHRAFPAPDCSVHQQPIALSCQLLSQAILSSDFVAQCLQQVTFPGTLESRLYTSQKLLCHRVNQDHAFLRLSALGMWWEALP